ncbi:hypothetical protein H4Q26_014508 [Puccinia striiformis f. sp. tritici PST-130]|nr:hypothetical protein H4Q26_014508 [Puccinia striiformis f. sp. tritici PST-130]
MTIERKGFFTSLTETGGITPHPQPNSSIQSNLAFEDESVGSDIPKMAGFEVISKTLAEQLLVEDQPFQFHEQVFWRPYEAYVYVYDKSIDEQRAKGKLVDHQGTAKIALYGVFSCRCSQRKPMRDAIRADRNFLAGKHRKPDLSHLPRRPAREALLDNWHLHAQSIAWACADIVRQYTNEHHGRRD